MRTFALSAFVSVALFSGCSKQPEPSEASTPPAVEAPEVVQPMPAPEITPPESEPVVDAPSMPEVDKPAVTRPAPRTDAPDWSKPYIVVNPMTTRYIQRVADLDRQRYFAVCDDGVGFENRIKDDAMYDYLVNELQISFGRTLGPIYRIGGKVTEDPKRPGYANIAELEKRKIPKYSQPSKRFAEDFAPNLDVAAHGKHNAYPEYMGRFETEASMKDEKHPQYLPLNVDAAAELAAASLKYGYTDLTRPRYFEPVNEPHWSFNQGDHLAKWHLKVMEHVHAATPEVKVGGFCSPVCYFYRNDYKSFASFQRFIDETGCDLDFYSFHVYDYLRWGDGEFNGRYQSGIALEGTLDLVQNYTKNRYGKEVDIVVSEHGGYIGSQPKGEYDGEVVAETILTQHYPNADTESWDFEMKKRSLVSFGHVSSILSNTLTFMDHPHVVQKAVPFLLVNTWGWSAHYYAGLYSPYEYTDKTQWVENDLTMFYKFFRGLNGRRVKALCNDPDLQVRAFVDGSKLYLAVNNQSLVKQPVALYGIDTREIEVRRLGRNADFTASYQEATIPTPHSLELAGREAMMIIADYGQTIKATAAINEVACYGDRIAVPAKDAEFQIEVPQVRAIEYAQLRIGLTRAPDADREVQVTFNGQPLEVPLEDCAERFVDKEYATTKIVYVHPKEVRAQNTVKVSFADGDQGTIGSAVLRVAVK